MSKRLAWLAEIDVLGFDLDGTLYPANAIPREIVYERMIKAVMKARSWDREKARREFEKVREQLGSHTKALRVFGIDGERFFTDVWDALPLSRYIQQNRALAETLRRLAGKYRLFVLSNSNRVDQIARKLQLIGINKSIFDALLSTIDIGAVKPDPEPFEAALRTMKCRPDEVLYVGDRVETDIEGARRVGMRTCLVGGESYLADVCVKDVVELGKIFL